MENLFFQEKHSTFPPRVMQWPHSPSAKWWLHAGPTLPHPEHLHHFLVFKIMESQNH